MNAHTDIPRSNQGYKLDPADLASIAYVCRQDERPRDLAATGRKQIAHLRRVFAYRGGHLPHTEDGRQHLLALLRVMAAIPKIKTSTLAKEAHCWAPLWSEAERDELVHRALLTPRVHRNTTLGLIIGLVDAEREACKAWGIWPIDLSRAEAKLRKRERSKEQKSEKRRAAGARPQSESLSATKPWDAEGISRSTWYDRQKRANETQPDNFGACIKEEDSNTGAETVRPYIPDVDRRAPKRDGAGHLVDDVESDTTVLDGGLVPPPGRAPSPPA